MLTFHEALFGLGVPATAAVLLFLVSQWLDQIQQKRRSNSTAIVGRPMLFAIGLAFIVGYVGLKRFPRLPPSEGDEWLVWAAGALLIVSVFHQRMWRTEWFSRLASLALFGLTIVAIVAALPDVNWSLLQKVMLGLGCWVAAAVVCLSLEINCRLESGVATSSALTILSILGAAVLSMSGVKIYGLEAAAIPAAIAPLVILTILVRSPLCFADAAPMFVLLFGGMLLCGYLYAELTVVNALLLFFAPLGLWLERLPGVMQWNCWQRGVIRVVAVFIPGGIAFGLALHKFLIDMGDFSTF